MSITHALSNALSGLTASSRGATVVSANLANLLTPGYAPRGVELTTQARGSAGGVVVVGITRQENTSLLNDRRLADSDAAYSEVRAGIAAEIERMIGTPDQPQSLSGRIAAFETSLVTAGSKPEEDVRLQDAVLRASELAATLNTGSDRIQQLRTEADGEIDRAVDQINTLLSQVRSLNSQIVNAHNTGHPTASLEDQRRVVLDELADYVPLRLAPRDKGAVAIFTPGGAILLDGTEAELTFTPSNVVAPHMTLGNGLLSGLEINGVPVAPSGANSPVSGGRLSALFEIRDNDLVDAQTQIDAVARDVVERFQDPAIDATRGPGDAGLFTDAGAAFVVADEVGLSGRLALNTAVDPAAGGALWRLRDGLGAVAPGPAGDAALLQDLHGALSNTAAMASGGLGLSPRSFAGHVAGLVSRFGQARLTLDQGQSFAAARQTSLKQMELAEGVDSDAEMQKLMLIEQAYGANARMIETIDEMIQTLLRL